MAGVTSHFLLAEVELHPFPEERRKTVFLWERVALYLGEDEVRKTLRGVRERAGGAFLTSNCVWSGGVKKTRAGRRHRLLDVRHTSFFFK